GDVDVIQALRPHAGELEVLHLPALPGAAVARDQRPDAAAAAGGDDVTTGQDDVAQAGAVAPAPLDPGPARGHVDDGAAGDQVVVGVRGAIDARVVALIGHRADRVPGHPRVGIRGLPEIRRAHIGWLDHLVGRVARR